MVVVDWRSVRWGWGEASVAQVGGLYSIQERLCENAATTACVVMWIAYVRAKEGLGILREALLYCVYRDKRESLSSPTGGLEHLLRTDRSFYAGVWSVARS